MKLVALCGAAGAGKDTASDMLPARKLAFADTLYREVAEAFGVTVEWLKDRRWKDVPQAKLNMFVCEDDGFIEFALDPCDNPSNPLIYSPRQILQWWGDYRRAQDPAYFVRKVAEILKQKPDNYVDWTSPPARFVITDVRFPNEAAMVRQLGGQIWQIKRPGYEAGGTGHASDTAGDEFAPDRVATNSGSLEDLRATVLAAWESS